MTFYQKIAAIGSKFIAKNTLYKYGFNWSPMYRRSTARITYVSKDLLNITIKLPLNYKNRNYMGSIFGGSLFAAVDPIPMIQLFNIIGNDYVVWDKSAEIYFKRPAKENLYANFKFSVEELEDIKKRVAEENEITIQKTTQLTNKEQTVVFCEVKKTIYVADKQFYKQKLAQRKKKHS